MSIVYRGAKIGNGRVLSQSDVHGAKVVMLPYYSPSSIVKKVEIGAYALRITIGRLNGRDITEIFSEDEINNSRLCEVIGLEYFPKQNDPLRVRHH